MFRGHPISDPRLMDEAVRRSEVSRKVSATTPEMAKRLQDVARLGPYLSPRTLLNLSRTGTSPDTIELMNSAMRKMSEENDSAQAGQNNKGFGAFFKNIFNPNFYTSRYNPKNPGFRGAKGKTPGTVISPQTGQEVAEPGAFAPVYEPLKTASRYAMTLQESGWSGINNFVFELNEDGTAPTGYQVLQKLGKLAEIVPTLGRAYTWNKDDIKSAFKYTEFGTLMRNRDNQGFGFQLPLELAAEQMMNVVGIDAKTGEPLPDYRGRTRFGEFTTAVPQGDGTMMEMEQPATLGGYIANLGYTAKRLPNGSIVEGKGLNLDEGAGSFISGAIDAIGEVFTDPSIIASQAAKATKVLALSSVAYSRLSPAARAAVEGGTAFERFFRAGMTIDDIPLTSKSWLEIETLRGTLDDELALLDDAVDGGRITPQDRDSLVEMKRSILTDAETKVWDADRLSEMIRTDSRWNFIFGLIDNAKTKYPDEETAAFIIRNKVFRNRISPEDAADLAKAQGPEGYREVFLKAADGLGSGKKALPDTVQELTVSPVGLGQISPNTAQRLQRLQQAREGVGRYYERMIMSPPVADLPGVRSVIAARAKVQKVATSPLAKGVQNFFYKMENLFELAPDVGIVVDGSVGQRMASIDAATSFARNLLSDVKDEPTVIAFASRVQKHLTENFIDIERLDNLGNYVTQSVRAPQTRAGVRAVEDEVYGLVETYLRKFNKNDKQVTQIMDLLKTERNKLKTWSPDEAGNPTDFGLMQRLGEYGLANLDEIALDLSTKYGQVVDPSELKAIAAATIQELYNHTLVLPDVKQLKELAENPFFRGALRGGEKGEKRFLVEKVDAIMKVWKQTNLANLGFLARNLLDGQVALWMGNAGINSMFHRPYRFYKIVKNKAGVEDILNNPMTKEQIQKLSQRMLDELTPSEKSMLSISRLESWGSYKEKTYAMQRMIETKDVVQVTKQDTTAYPVAVVQSLRKIHADPLERILAQIQGIPDPTVRKDILMEWLFGTERGQFTQTQVLEAYRTGGIEIGLPKEIVAGLRVIKKFELGTKTDRLAFWDSLIDTVITGRIEKMSQVPELRIMMSHNVVPILDRNGRAIVQNISLPAETKFAKRVSSIPGDRAATMDNVTGALYESEEGKHFFVESAQPTTSGWDVKLIELETRPEMRTSRKKVIETTGGEPQVIDPFTGEMPTTPPTELSISTRFKTVEEVVNIPISAWVGRNGEPSIEALRASRALFEKPELIPNLPEKLPFFPERELTNPEKVAEKWRDIVDRVFIGTFGGAELTFEKLPAYRQFKWEEYAKHYDSLSQTELQRAERNVVLGAKRLKMSKDDYMGGATLREKVLDQTPLPAPLGQGPFAKLQAARKRAAGRPDRGYTLEQLDAYASSVAEYNMRQFFYDAPKKFNVETVEGLEWFFTFIAAQRSIVQRFARLIVANPTKPYRIARSFNGSTELNMPGDYENGITYWDPLSKQWKMRHPISYFARLTASGLGLGEELESVTPYIGAPIKGLSIGLTGLPNVAPLGAIALNAVLDTVANLTDNDEGVDAFRRTVMPFEALNKDKSTLDRLTPAWVSKGIQLIRSAAMNQKTAIVQKELGDAGRALWTTGLYDSQDRVDRMRFDRDVKVLAQVGVFYSIVSQFLGPAAGTPEYTVNIKGVDMNAAALAEERQRLLDEDYETGNMKFYLNHGEQILLYMVGKTTATANTKGFMMTQKYVDWVKKNEFDVTNYTSGIGYYFGPPDEDEYSFGARAYLVDNKLIRYREPFEMVKAANYTIASMKYRVFRNSFKTYLSKQDQAGLREYRNILFARYGYTGPDFNPNEFPQILSDLNKILEEKAFADSPLSSPLKQYLTFRQALLQANDRTTFRSKAMTEARAQLDQFAETLMAKGNPEFQRLYDRVLAQETDPAGFDENDLP